MVKKWINIGDVDDSPGYILELICRERETKRLNLHFTTVYKFNKFFLGVGQCDRT